ncbi:MAG TPA: hypothetical protein VF618_19525 [Thermoanaerobaculia bacterium]
MQARFLKANDGHGIVVVRWPDDDTILFHAAERQYVYRPAEKLEAMARLGGVLRTFRDEPLLHRFERLPRSCSDGDIEIHGSPPLWELVDVTKDEIPRSRSDDEPPLDVAVDDASEDAYDGGESAELLDTRKVKDRMHHECASPHRSTARHRR